MSADSLSFDALLWVTGSEPPPIPKARAITVDIPGVWTLAPATAGAGLPRAIEATSPLRRSSGAAAPVAVVDPALPIAAAAAPLLSKFAEAAVSGSAAAAEAPLPWFVVGAGPEALETAAMLATGARGVRRAAVDRARRRDTAESAAAAQLAGLDAAAVQFGDPAFSPHGTGFLPGGAIRAPKVVLLCNEASPLASMLPPFMAQWIAARIARARLPVQPYTGVQFLQLHRAVPPVAKPVLAGEGRDGSPAIGSAAAPVSAALSQPPSQAQPGLQLGLPPQSGRVVLYTVATYDALKTAVQPADAVLFAPPAGAWMPAAMRLAEGVGAAAIDIVEPGPPAVSSSSPIPSSSSPSAGAAAAAAAAALVATRAVLSSPQRMNAIELDSGRYTAAGQLRDGLGYSSGSGSGAAVAATAELQSCAGVFVAGDGMRYADVGSGTRVRHARDADAAVASAGVAAHNLLCSLGINTTTATGSAGTSATGSGGTGASAVAGTAGGQGQGQGPRLFTHTPTRDYSGAMAAVLGVRLTTIGNVDAGLETHAFFTAAAPPAATAQQGSEDADAAAAAAASAEAEAEAAGMDDSGDASSSSTMAADFARSRPSPHLRRLGSSGASANANVTAAGAGVSSAHCFGIVFYTSGARVEGALLWNSTGAGSFGLARAAARTSVQLPGPGAEGTAHTGGLAVEAPVALQTGATDYTVGVLQRLLTACSAPTTASRFQLPVNRDEQAALLKPIAAALLASQLTADASGTNPTEASPRSAVSGNIQHVWSTGRVPSASQRPHPLGFV